MGGKKVFSKLIEWNDFVAIIIIIALVFLVYSSVVVCSYGFLDDYYFLHNAAVGSNGTITLLLGAGRPLNAFLLDFAFRAAGSVENLSSLRILTLVGMSLVGSGLYLFSRRHDVSIKTSLFLAFGILLLPSFQVYSAWTQHFTTPFSGAIALLAAYSLTPICDVRGRSQGFRIFISTILLSIAILIYQPIAMLFFTGLLISIFTSRQPSVEWNLGRLVSVAITFFLAMLVGFLAFKIGQFYYPAPSDRSGLANNFLGKSIWFLSEPLRNALSFYAVPGQKSLAYASAAFIFFGYLLYFIKHNFRTGIYVMLISTFFVICSYAPNLMSAENWASYRSIGALSSSLLVILIVLTIDPICEILFFNPGSIASFLWKSSFVFFIATFIVTSILAQSNVYKSLVLPNVTEINNLASYLKEKNDLKDVKQIIVHPSSWKDSSASPMAYDEFGMHSSLRDYYAIRIVDIVCMSLNLFRNAEIIIATNEDRSSDFDGQQIYVDFRQMVTGGRFKSVALTLVPGN